MLDANFNASSRSNSHPNRSGPNEPGAIRAFFCISFISATFRVPPSARSLKPTEPQPAAGAFPATNAAHSSLVSGSRDLDPQKCTLDAVLGPISADFVPAARTISHAQRPAFCREPQPGHQDLKANHLAIDSRNVKICPSDPRAAARSPSFEVRVSAPAARVPRPIEAKPRARNLPPSAAARAPRSAVWRTCKGAGSPQTITVKIKQLSLIKKSAILRP